MNPHPARPPLLTRAVRPFAGLLPTGPGPRVTLAGTVATLLAHAVAFTAVAHCHYLIWPPKGLLWFGGELLLAVLVWPVVRWAVGRAGAVLTPRQAGLWFAAGLFLAAWWHGRAQDTVWVHARSLWPTLHVALFLAHVGVFGGLLAGVLALLIATDPADAPDAGPRRSPPVWVWCVTLGLFAAAANGLAVWFVGRETGLYYCDYMAYWTWAADWIEACRHGPADGWERFRESVQQPGYTLIPATLPGASMAAFGDGRLAYILGVVNGHLLPVAVAAGWATGRLAPRAGWLAVAVPAAWLVTLPMAWPPVLRGYPDVGGAALALLTVGVYLGKPRRDLRWPDLLALAGLLVGMALFRRWYSFWLVAFVLLMGVEAGLAAVPALLRRRWLDAWHAVRPVLAVGGLTGLGLVLLAAPMVRATAAADYSDAYAGYKSAQPLAVRAAVAAGEVGPGCLLLAGLGLAAMIVARDSRRAGLFVAGMVPVMGLHFLRVQDLNPHHLYLFLPAVLLLPTVPAARELARLPAWAAAAGIGLIMVVGAVWLAPVLDERAEGLRGRLAPTAVCRPLVRPDRPEVERLLDALAAEPGAWAVVSSSPAFHPSMLACAGRGLGRPAPAADRLLPTQEVDRVTGFPASLFRASLVLVADPVQTHLPDVREQQTVVVPARHLLAGTGVGAAFDRLSAAFPLHDGVTVRLFRRARPVDRAAFDAFCEELRAAHPDRPFVYRPATPVEELLKQP
ncbi:MAG: hypothetical protein U0871_23085 [Gemmataceae bacterium]